MIYKETQKERDDELSILTGTPLETIAKMEIAAPESICIYKDGPVQTAEEMAALYSSYKNLSLVHYFRTLMFTSVHKRHPELKKLILETRNRTCLDFGSGVGTHAIALMENGNHVSILDIQGPLLDFAVQRIQYRGFAHDRYFLPLMPLPENQFDVVICTNVLEHVFDPVQDLQRITKCLKVGGTLHLQVSTMVKPSSGHFPHSIKKWLSGGPTYLAMNYIKQGGTIFVKQ